MHRFRRLSQIWNWLPAFRVVAESEHLPTAAKALGVSPPALSRAIGLLEDRVGAELFSRHRRRLTLNDAGRELLDAVRLAMRGVDDGWDRATDAAPSGPVTVAIDSGAAGLLLPPALAALATQFPEVVPHIVGGPERGLEAALLDGRIDLALTEQTITSPRLRNERLRAIPVHLYCADSSPLARARRPSRATILKHPFVAPGRAQSDSWPSATPRQIGVVTDSVTWAVALCASGAWIAALPESVETLPHHGLKRLEARVALRPLTIRLVTRRPASPAQNLEKIVEVVRRSLSGKEIGAP